MLFSSLNSAKLNFFVHLCTSGTVFSQLYICTFTVLFRFGKAVPTPLLHRKTLHGSCANGIFYIFYKETVFPSRAVGKHAMGRWRKRIVLHQLAQLIFLFQGSWAVKSVQLTSWFDAIRISLIFAPGMELIFCFFPQE